LYLIFEQPTAHPVVYLSQSESPLEAIRAYIREEEPGAEFGADGSLRVAWDGYEVMYPHPLAYVEAACKSLGEWQIRELPVEPARAPLTEAFCGEDTSDVAAHLDACRPLLRRQFPRSRAPGFLWYLRDGLLVTCYRKRRPGEIQVLARFVRRWDAGGDYVLWNGDYEELLGGLYLGPGPVAVLQP
jgi:hypothetical protein